MAKKIAVPEQGSEGTIQEKTFGRKRSKCCTCCLILLVVNLVILAVGVGIGWYFGDKFTRQEFGMSLGDTLGVVSDMYWTDDGDVVKRPYKASDLDGFYSEIKRNVFLEDDAELDFDGALALALEKYLSSSSDPVNAAAEGGDGTGTEDGGTETSMIDIFVDMIANVMDREHIDTDRLNRYPDKDEYIFNLNDRQLAAFVNTVLRSVLAEGGRIEGLSDVSDVVDLKNIVSLKQIRFTAKSSKTESGEENVYAASADITLWLGLQKAAGNAIEYYMKKAGSGWASGILGWFGDVILPENVYVTMTVPLYGDDAPHIKINDMNAAERKRADKLINGILSMSGNNKKLDDILADFIGKIKPYLEKAADKMDFTLSGSGTIAFDLLETVTDMAGGDTADPLTKSDFIYVLQAMMSDRAEQLDKLQPFRYENRYLVNGKDVYIENGGADLTPIDYEREFINEIGRAYAIDFDKFNAENETQATLTDILDMLGVSLDGGNTGFGSKDLLNMIDADAFEALLDSPDTDGIKLRVTDRMLAAALSGQMDLLISAADSGFADLKLKLLALTFTEKRSVPGRQYALMAVEAYIDDVLTSLDGNSLVTKLASGLLPESILLTVTADITPGLAAEQRDRTEFIINSCQNTDRAIATLEKLVPSLDLNSVSVKISDMLNDMLGKLRENLDIELVSESMEYNVSLGEWEGGSGLLVMPDIFTVVTDTVLVKDGEPVVTPQELKNVVRDLNNPDMPESNIDTEKGYKDFIGEVADKYYFNVDTAQIDTFDKLTAYLTDFSTDKFRIDGTNGLAHDKRTAAMLRPTMKSGELGALLLEQMQSNDLVSSYDIIRVTTGTDMLSVGLAIDLTSLMNGAEEIQKLISADKLYVTAVFDLSDEGLTGSGTADDPYGYGVALNVNVKTSAGLSGVMDKESTYPAMLEIVKFFAPSFDMQKQMDEFGIILYDRMQKLNDSLGSDALTVETAASANAEYFGFTENGLEIVDFYTFLALKMKPGLLDSADPNTIKKTLQGMYGYDPAVPNENNYIADFASADGKNILFNKPIKSDVRDGHGWTREEAVAFTMGTSTVADGCFNGYLAEGISEIASVDDVKVEQTVVLAKGDISSKAAQVRTWANDRLKPSSDHADLVTSQSDYLMLTFSMSMENYLGDKGTGTAGTAAGLFPVKVYATIVFEYKNGEFVKTGDLIFNNMNNSEYKVMVELMSISPESSDSSKINILTVSKKGEDVLNLTARAASEIVFAEATDKTDGSIGTFTFKSKFSA